MKATLEFDLETERQALELVLAAPRLYSTLLEIQNALRNQLKHGPLQPEREFLEQLRGLALNALDGLE